MTNKSSKERKRRRNSSKQSTPAAKNQKTMATMSPPTDDKNELLPGPSHTPANLAEVLDKVLQGQNDIKSSLNASILNTSKSLETMINRKMEDLRAEVNTKFNAVSAEIQALKTRVEAVEQRPAADISQADLTPLTRRIESVETQVAAADQYYSTAPTLIVKGLQEANGETEDSLKTECQSILNALLPTQPVRITAAKRLGTEHPRRRGPRLASIMMRSTEDLKIVMRNKRRLKDIDEGKDIYIEPSKPDEMRKLESSIRQLAKQHPTLEYKRGQVKVKANTAAPGNNNGGQGNQGPAPRQ